MSRHHSYNDDNNSQSTHSSSSSKNKDCKACFDFKDWLTHRSSRQEERRQQNQTAPHPSQQQQQQEVINTTKQTTNARRNCPLYRDELGRATWGFLHTMAAYYPEKPTVNEEKKMETFIDGLATFFPCDECATDFQDEIKKNPPRTKNRHELSQWFCEQHNIVNRKLSKPEFDCSKIFERWKDGWKDGSCD